MKATGEEVIAERQLLMAISGDLILPVMFPVHHVEMKSTI